MTDILNPTLGSDFVTEPLPAGPIAERPAPLQEGDCTNEFIWGQDFDDRVLATKVFWADTEPRIRTYGQLAQAFTANPDVLNLEEAEANKVRILLLARNLIPTPEKIEEAQG